MTCPIRFPFVCALLLAASSHAIAMDFDRLPIEYSTAKTDNAISKLERRLKASKVPLKADDEHGYLSSVLKALDVPISSQLLVYSKTSLQRSRIGPKTPRAI